MWSSIRHLENGNPVAHSSVEKKSFNIVLNKKKFCSKSYQAI